RSDCAGAAGRDVRAASSRRSRAETGSGAAVRERPARRNPQALCKRPRSRHLAADRSMIGWARNEPYDYPEKTGILARTERHCAGLEGALGLLGIPPRWLHSHCGASVVTARDAVVTDWRIPMKLTDTQLVLLSAASQRKDNAVETKLKGGAADKVI